MTCSTASQPAIEAATGTAELAGYGRITWDAFRGLLGGAQAAWASYDGFHIGTAPAEPPPYSHLWAWTDQWLHRARIEGDHVIVGALILQARPANLGAADDRRASATSASPRRHGPWARSGSGRCRPAWPAAR